MTTERRAFIVDGWNRQSAAMDGVVPAPLSRRCEPSVYVMARSCGPFKGGVVRSGVSGLGDRRRELASRWAAGGSEGSVLRSPRATGGVA